MASISAKDPDRPFIFQLPATNGRTPGVIQASPPLVGRGCYHRGCAYAKRVQAPLDKARSLAQTRSDGTERKDGNGEMLESMRNAAQGVVGKAIMTVVMGLIIVSFVIWGVGDMLRGFTTSTVASVGGTKISAQEYRVAYDRAVQQYQRRLRRPFTNEEARQIGLDRSVLQQLLSEAAVDDEAHKLGLDISDEALREIITSNPNFRDKSGAFDPARFAGALRDMDMSERGFVSELRKQVLRQFIVAALATGVAAPKAESEAEADYQGQTRSADYFLLPASAAGDIPAASEEALKTFYNDRKSSYRAPEYRGMTVLALEPDTIANPAEVSDADAEAAYQKLAGKDPKFGAPEKRDLQQILFPNEARRRRGRGQAQGRRRLRRPRQGARPESRRHRHRRDDQGRDARQGRGRRRLRLAARGRQRRAEEPVWSGDRSRQRRHPVHGQAIRRGRGRGEAAGLRFARRRQDPGPARQDRGRAGVGQNASSKPPRPWA